MSKTIEFKFKLRDPDRYFENPHRTEASRLRAHELADRVHRGNEGVTQALAATMGWEPGRDGIAMATSLDGRTLRVTAEQFGLFYAHMAVLGCDRGFKGVCFVEEPVDDVVDLTGPTKPVVTPRNVRLSFPNVMSPERAERHGKYAFSVDIAGPDSGVFATFKAARPSDGPLMPCPGTRGYDPAVYATIHEECLVDFQLGSGWGERAECDRYMVGGAWRYRLREPMRDLPRDCISRVRVGGRSVSK